MPKSATNTFKKREKSWEGTTRAIESASATESAEEVTGRRAFPHGTTIRQEGVRQDHRSRSPRILQKTLPTLPAIPCRAFSRLNTNPWWTRILQHNATAAILAPTKKTILCLGICKLRLEQLFHPPLVDFHPFEKRAPFS